jgi:SAM-dependent methyltransferase
MNEYYARRAPEHDSLMSYVSNEEMERLLGPIIADIETQIANENVLEIACGTGNWTQVLSKRANHVLATDVNATVIEIARGKPYVGDNVTFAIEDAYTIGKLDGTFNLVFAADWYSHIPRSAILSFVQNVRSVLRPGGRVILIDMLPKIELDRMYSHHDSEGNRIERRRLEDQSYFQVVKNFPSQAELHDTFAGYVSEMTYRIYDELKRWLFTCVVK